VGQVEGMGEESVRGFGGKAEGKGHLEGRGIDGRMGSEWIIGRPVGVGGVVVN
jgi:hypothetical protein